MTAIKNSILVLGSLHFCVSQAYAADSTPTRLYPIQQDLARPSMQLHEAFDFRLGLDYTEGQKYVLQPRQTTTDASSSIKRQLSFNLRLPYKFEAGMALADSQQAVPDQIRNKYGNVKHKSQHLGLALWVRSYLIQTDKISSSVILQYDAGTADQGSFSQASQDRTSLGLHLDVSPIAYTSLGVYVLGSHRKNEHYRAIRLNNEAVYGARLALGPKDIQLFGDGSIRALTWKDASGHANGKLSKSFEVGLSSQWKSLSAQLSTFIPNKERFFGVPERGYRFALQWAMQKPKAALTPAPTASESIEALIKSEDDLTILSDTSKEPTLDNIPLQPDMPLTEGRTSETLAPVPQTTELDEFQKWEMKNAEEAKARGKESAVEKLEHQYRAAAEKERAQAAAEEQRMAAQQTAQEEAARRAARANSSMSVAEQKAALEKLKYYPVSDRDDLNWNGLE